MIALRDGAGTVESPPIQAVSQSGYDDLYDGFGVDSLTSTGAMYAASSGATSNAGFGGATYVGGATSTTLVGGA